MTKQLQQGIENDHFRVKKNMPKVGGFRSFNSARKSIAGFKTMLWLRKGSDYSGQWSVREQNDLLVVLFRIEKVSETWKAPKIGRDLPSDVSWDTPSFSTLTTRPAPLFNLAVRTLCI